MSSVREMGMEQEAGPWPLAQSRENMNGETEVYVFMSRFTAKPKMDGFRAQMVDCIPGWRRDDFFSLLWRLRNWHLCEQPETEPMMWQCTGISTVRHPQASQAANIDNEAKVGGSGTHCEKHTGRQKQERSDAAATILRHNTGRLCTGRNPMCVHDDKGHENGGSPCPCDSILPTGWVQEQSWFSPEALFVLQMQPWLPSYQSLLLPCTRSWNIKNTL